MRNGSSTLIQIAAWHEAGHALATLREGRSLVTARVLRDQPGNGFAQFVPTEDDDRYDPLLGPGPALANWKVVLDDRLATVRILLAGPLAEAKALNRPLRSIGSSMDMAMCESILEELHRIFAFTVKRTRYRLRTPLEHMELQRNRVRRWLGRPQIWRAVELVAEKLTESSEASAADVLQCYLAARSPRQIPLGLDWISCMEKPDEMSPIGITDG